mgnify:FL=1
MRQPPDFSLGNWRYEEIFFYYVIDEKIFSVQLPTEELHQLSDREIKKEIKNYESKPFWFRTECRFKDLDADDYAVKYKDYRYQTNETLVFGYDWTILGRSIVRALHFVVPREKTKEKSCEVSGRIVFWFLRSSGIWQEADFGDAFSTNCIVSRTVENKLEKVIITIYDLYKNPKESIEIIPQQ